MNISIEEMPREIARLEDENEKLKEDLGKMIKLFTIEREKNRQTIEYIQDRYDGEVLTHTFDKCNVGELLEILKGSDKE